MEMPYISIKGELYWLDEVDPYKAVDLMGNWRLSFKNNDTRIQAKMQLKKLYKNRWFKKFISLFK